MSRLFLISASVLALTASAVPALAQDGRPAQWSGMGFLAWLIVGLIAGFLASLAVNRSGSGIIVDIILGIIGAYIGGAIFHAFGSVGVTGFNAWSILVAFVGAVVLLVIYHAITGTSRAGRMTNP